MRQPGPVPELVVYLVPPIACMAAALAISDAHRLLLLGLYVGCSLVLGGATTAVRRRRDPAPARLGLRTMHPLAATVLALVATGGLFGLAWGFAAVSNDSFAGQLALVAILFTGSTTVPGLATLGSRGPS